MVECPYCKNDWIKDDDPTCEECLPFATIDMVLQSLQESASTLKVIKTIDGERLDWLNQVMDELVSLRENFQRAT